MPWPSLVFLDKGLSYLGIALAAAVLVRLWREDLARIYKAFTALVLFDCASTFGLLTLDYHTDLYGLTWMSVEAVKLLLYSTVALELYDVALRPFPGILRAGRTVVAVSLGLATVITLVTLQLDLTSIAEFSQHQVLHYFYLIQRSIIFTLAVFQIFVLAFLFWFSIRLSSNARLYAAIYVLYFTSRSAVLLAANLFGAAQVQPWSVANAAVYCVCLCAWALLLRRSSEDAETNRPMFSKRTDPVALTAKLEAINKRLSRTGKRE